MVSVPTEKRYEKHIEKELINLIDDGLQFNSKLHKENDDWYNKKLCLVENEFINFISFTSFIVSSKSFFSSPGYPTMKSLDNFIKGLIFINLI